MACMVISIISCTNEKTDRPAGSSNQPSEITKVSHPAQTKPVKQENKHIKIDARGGTVGDQIKQQQIIPRYQGVKAIPPQAMHLPFLAVSTT